MITQTLKKMLKHCINKNMWGINMDGGERQIGKTFAEIEPKHIERYSIATQYCDGKVVLDAACGIGYGSNMMKHKGKAKNVLGVDKSLEALEYASVHWRLPHIRFQQFDLESRCFDELGVFQVIVSFETLEHLEPYPTETLEKFNEILEPGGYLIYSHPENEKPPGGRYHKHTKLFGRPIIKHMEQYNYEVVFDWLQPSRPRDFNLPYHVVVLKKCKL
jgi:2-polyprenyl-3-methyl-5-hydroxy-6-metoxy-1,4-benzoquinol methylase